VTGTTVAKAEFRDFIVTEDEVTAGASKEGEVVINDRIADSVFRRCDRTADYDVFATPNLNGDYLSDACAAQVGQPRHRAGANERRHRLLRGDARHRAKCAGKDVINPGSVILSGVMMLQSWAGTRRPISWSGLRRRSPRRR
jgi:isocitrate dehydrogenase